MKTPTPTKEKTEALEFQHEATFDESLGAYVNPDIREVTEVMPYGDYVWDIETAPAWNIVDFFDWDPTQSKAWETSQSEFDPDAVKLGNIKDPEKQKAKIFEAEKRWRIQRLEAVEQVQRDEQAARTKLFDRAPLSAATGRVVAVGIRSIDSGDSYVFSDVFAAGSTEWEERILLHLYRLFQTEPRHWYGFNSIHFDLSFIVRRGYVLGLNPPSVHSIKARHTDLLDFWRCGDRREFVSMDTLAIAMGLTRKNGDGADFWKDHMLGGENRRKALAYLMNDLQMTQEICERMT
jgi:hypothetical protein